MIHCDQMEVSYGRYYLKPGPAMKSPQDAGRLVRIMHFNCIAITLFALLSSALAVPTPIFGIGNGKSKQTAPNPSQNAGDSAQPLLRYPLHPSKGIEKAPFVYKEGIVPPQGTRVVVTPNQKLTHGRPPGDTTGAKIKPVANWKEFPPCTKFALDDPRGIWDCYLPDDQLPENVMSQRSVDRLNHLKAGPSPEYSGPPTQAPAPAPVASTSTLPPAYSRGANPPGYTRHP